MPSGYGHAVLAAGLALCLTTATLGQVSDKQDVQSTKEEPKTATQEQPKSPAPVSPAPPSESRRAPVYQPDCERPKDRDEADLCEQRRMAEAAIDTANWAKKQFWATVWEIVALVGTIAVAVFAVFAAFSANRISRESAERQLRAYVCVMNTKISRENDRVIHAVVYMKNSGQTPARNVTSRTTISIGPVIDFSPREDDDGVGSRATIGAGDPYTLQARSESLDDEVWTEVFNRDIPFWVWGELSYDDIFGKERRHTYFRLRLHDKDEYLYPVFDGNETT